MADRPPNILWLMTDQHRADCLGVMGHPVAQTPNLDALAASGVCFEQAYCQSPVCMASRASVMTGRYPQAVGVRGMGILPAHEVTVGEHLQRAGYRTGAFGKLHLTPQLYTGHVLGVDEPVLDLQRFGPAALPEVAADPAKTNYGFQTYVGYDDALKGKHRRWLQEREPALLDAVPERFGDDHPRDLWVSPYPEALHPTTFVAERCVDYLRAQSGDEPWFSFCSFVAPHHPFEAPAETIARFPLEEMPLPDRRGGVVADHIPDPMRGAIDEMDRYSETAQRRLVQHYLAAIRLIDDGIGSIMQALRETGQLDNTIIVFVADHGEFLGQHGLLRKPSIHFDAVTRVPLILRLPDGHGAGRRESGLVELVDVLPTLLGAAGLAPPPGIQGIDWSPAIRSGAAIGRDDIYSEMHDLSPMTHAKPKGPYGACLTLRTPEWKLNVYPTAGPQYGQLFHLAEDPGECVDRFDDPTVRDTRDALLFRLLQRVHQQADPLPLRLTQY